MGFNPHQCFGVNGSVECPTNYYDAAASLMRHTQLTLDNYMQYLRSRQSKFRKLIL